MAARNKRLAAILEQKHKIWPDDVVPWIIFRMRPLLDEFLALPQDRRLEALEMLVSAAGLDNCSEHAAAADVILHRLKENGAKTPNLTFHERGCALVHLADVTGIREPWRLAVSLYKILGKEDRDFEANFASFSGTASSDL